MNLKVLLIYCYFVYFGTHSVEGWWFGSSKTSKEREEPRELEDQSKKTAKFEVLDAEEKFLSATKVYMSELDYCHERVMDSLEKTCGDITEEDLAKLSVQLLNCQSESEGRPTFECSEDMSIAECTSNMDPHVWNAYHIISNRARSVCYATRQQQFRRRTEAAVNKLTQSTQHQILAMEVLFEDQQAVQSAAKESLQVIKTQHTELSVKQDELKNAHNDLKSSVSLNIDELAKEKSLIARSQEQLMTMTESVLKKLENATDQIEDQETDRKTQHSELVSDLTELREKARDVWTKINESMVHLMSFHERTSVSYQQTLEDLKNINTTINYILTVMDNLDHAINTQLSWLMRQVGGAKEGLTLLYTVAINVAFLFFFALFLMFVQAPALPRLVLILSVIGNTLIHLYCDYSLDVLTLAALVASITIGDWIVSVFKRRQHVAQVMIGSASQSETFSGPAHQSSPIVSSSHSILFSNVTEDSQISLKAATTEDFLDDDTIEEQVTCMENPSRKQATDTLERLGRSERGYLKCRAITRGGASCKMKQTMGSPYCKRHFRMNN